MKFKDVVILITIHLVSCFIGTLLFILSFHSPLLRDISVLFYRGIGLLIISCLMMSIFLFLLKIRLFNKLVTYRDIILNVVLILSFNIVFFTHVPITADRSVTVFILGYMSNHSDKIITKDEMTKVFKDKYVDEYGAMTRRFDEQLVSGNIEKTTDGYKITHKGKQLMKIFDITSDLFGIDKKFISP